MPSQISYIVYIFYSNLNDKFDKICLNKKRIISIFYYKKKLIIIYGYIVKQKRYRDNLIKNREKKIVKLI